VISINVILVTDTLFLAKRNSVAAIAAASNLLLVMENIFEFRIAVIWQTFLVFNDKFTGDF
jgi:hypothetical protein